MATVTRTFEHFKHGHFSPKQLCCTKYQCNSVAQFSMQILCALQSKIEVLPIEYTSYTAHWNKISPQPKAARDLTVQKMGVSAQLTASVLVVGRWLFISRPFYSGRNGYALHRFLALLLLPLSLSFPDCSFPRHFCSAIVVDSAPPPFCCVRSHDN